MKSVLVVGGYGEVGSHAVKILSSLNYQVVIAGRSPKKAEQFISTNKLSNVLFRSLDISKFSEQWQTSLKDISFVLMCTDHHENSFIEHVLRSGISYLDITADDKSLLRIESLDAVAKASGATALLSVGLAPGLTNLLVKEASSKVVNAKSAQIGILLGVGDSHGQQALRWTMDNLLDKDDFSTGVKISYSRPWKMRRSYPFDFSDQHSLARTTSLQSVKTFMCFSSAILTTSMFWLRHPWLRGLAKKMRALLLKTSSMPMGFDRGYALSVTVSGKQEQVTYKLKGEVEALVTGVTAAACADSLLKNPVASGVVHIHQVLNMPDLWPALRRFAKAELEGPL